MTKVAIVCILIACVMPIVIAGLAKWLGGFRASHNQHPRQFFNGLDATSMAARAHAAQLNSFEILPVFIAGVLIAMYVVLPAYLINVLSMAFIVFRVLYVVCYVYNWSGLRSIVWTFSFMCPISLFLLSLWMY